VRRGEKLIVDGLGSLVGSGEETEIFRGSDKDGNSQDGSAIGSEAEPKKVRTAEGYEDLFPLGDMKSEPPRFENGERRVIPDPL